jgi:hypothetical protein
VPPDRATLRFFLRRCFLEGLGKAALAGLTADPLRAEHDYVRREVPRAIMRNLCQAAVDRRTAPVARAVAMTAGVVSAGVGYAWGRAVALA